MNRTRRLIERLNRDAPPRDPSACEHCGALFHRSEDCAFGPPEQQRRRFNEFRANPLVREVVRRMSALRKEQRRGA